MHIFLNFLYLFYVVLFFTSTFCMCTFFTSKYGWVFVYGMYKNDADFLLHSLCCNTVSKMKRCYSYPMMKYLRTNHSNLKDIMYCSLLLVFFRSVCYE